MPSFALPFASFDKDRLQKAVPLRLVRKGAALPEDFSAMAARVGFEGGMGQLLPHGQGIIAGIGKGDEPLGLGAVAAKLGKGDYYVDGPLDLMDALGWALGAYQFTRYKKGSPQPTLILPEAMDMTALTSLVEAGYLVRDLINTPAEDMGPAELAEAAAALATGFAADLTVIDGAALEEGFPLIHAVGRAATRAPKLIDLRWGEASHPAVTLVGKGVCFDSGGLNMKGGAGMALMKKDMGGAANALGLAHMIMAAKLPVNLRVLIPAVENAVAGNAFRPGDVFKSRKGLTVEISNTDAEGRLILADALAYAAEATPARIISLATLTGAARIALGPDLSPVYATDLAFRGSILTHGEQSADLCWPMPFHDRYDEYLASKIADVNHASPNSFAGSITAALFLRRFVPETIPYTHLDIFGWVPKSRPGRPVGGEAMSIRALFGALSEEYHHSE